MTYQNYEHFKNSCMRRLREIEERIASLKREAAEIRARLNQVRKFQEETNQNE